MIMKYLFYTLLLLCITAAVLMLDGYLKTLHARENPEQAAILQANLHEQIRYNKLAFDFVPDYT